MQKLHDLIALMQDVQEQFRQWHWNTREFVHLATEEVYKGLIDPLDGLAETYREMSGELYDRGEMNGTYIKDWTKEKMNQIITGTIKDLNETAQNYKDEGLNGYCGDCIQVLRACKYKIG